MNIRGKYNIIQLLVAATSDLPWVMFSTIASIRRSVNHSRIIVPPFYFQLNKNQLTSQISLLGQLFKLSSYHCQPPHWGYLTFAIALCTKVRQGAAIVQFQIRHGRRVKTGKALQYSVSLDLKCNIHKYRQESTVNLNINQSTECKHIISLPEFVKRSGSGRG